VQPDTGAGDPSALSDSKRVLLLMSSRTYRAGSFIKAAEELGVSLTVGTEAETPLAGQGGLHINFSDPEGAAEAIQAFASNLPFDAVVPAEDDGTWLAAEASMRLGLPHNPPEMVAAVRDKAAMREHMAESGLPAPEGFRIDIDSDPEDLAGELSYPSVLKPRFLSGSQGVIRVNNPGEFVFAFQRVRRLIQQPEIRNLGGQMGNSLWCEVYVPGNEVAVEGMLNDGILQILALFDKPDPLLGPYFEETIYVTPSRHPQGIQVKIVETTQQVVQAFGLKTGPVHVELRINPEGVYVIDLAPRSIGGLCSKALRFDQGDSLEALILRQALGVDVRGVRRESAASGVMMIPIPHGGRLNAMAGMQAARAVSGVEEVIISVPIGEELVPLPEGGSYLGFIFARSDAPHQVEAALRQAHAELEFDIQPG
jgi:biotin carboxylase